jgi:hypothetical protein
MPARILLAVFTILLSIPSAAQTKVTAKRLPNRTLRQLAERPGAPPIVRDRRHDERKPAGASALRVRREGRVGEQHGPGAGDGQRGVGVELLSGRIVDDAVTQARPRLGVEGRPRTRSTPPPSTSMSTRKGA